MAAKEHWYCIRTKPGTQRMAPAMVRSYDDARSRIARLAKRSVPAGETIIERDCRDAGVEIFMPGYWTELKHHRTKEWFQKRFPLLTGYAFINLPDKDFGPVRKVDSVGAVLKPSLHRDPFEFSALVIEQLRAVEEEEEQKFLLKKAFRQRQEEGASQHMSRREIKEMFPAGRRMRISGENAVVGGLFGRVVGASSQGTVKMIVEMLNGMVKIDIPVELLEEVA